MVFKGKFFSIAGQKERLTNVLNVFKAIPSGKVKANVSNRTVKASLEFVANNPLTAAGLLTPVGLAGKSIAKAGIKATTSKVASRIASSSTKTKFIAGTIGTASIAAASSAPKATVIKAAGGLTPESFARAGRDVGKVASGGKSILDVAKENPIITGAAALVGASVIGRAALPAIAGAVQSQRQISATKDLTKSVTSQAAKAIPVTQTIPVTPSSPIQSSGFINPSANEEPEVKAVATPANAGKAGKLNLKQEINIGNFIKNKTYKKKNGTYKRTKRIKRK